MGAVPDVRVEQIAAAIERYLALHPSAADSSHGIAQWWLPATGMAGVDDEVEQALLLLEARGAIESVFVGELQRLWRAVARRPETDLHD